MPFTTLGKNAMLNSAGVDRVGAFTAQATKAITGANATDVISSAAHGYAAGDLVIFEGLTGGSNIKAGNAGNADEGADPYFVVATNLAAGTFSVSRTPGGPVEDLGSDITAGNVRRLVEVAGGTYARVAIAFAAAASAVLDDTTNGATINMPALAQLDYLGYWNNASGELRAIDKVPQEVYSASGGQYVVNDSKLSLVS
jgi:hypothetical protein